MGLSAFRTLSLAAGDTSALSRFQDNVARAFQALLGNPALDYTLLEDVPLTITVDNSVAHGLGRAVRGVIVTRKAAAQDVWISSTINSTPSLYVFLKSSVTGTVDLYLF